jgi:hypothetical protein
MARSGIVAIINRSKREIMIFIGKKKAGSMNQL